MSGQQWILACAITAIAGCGAHQGRATGDAAGQGPVEVLEEGGPASTVNLPTGDDRANQALEVHAAARFGERTFIILSAPPRARTVDWARTDEEFDGSTFVPVADPLRLVVETRNEPPPSEPWHIITYDDCQPRLNSLVWIHAVAFDDVVEWTWSAIEFTGCEVVEQEWQVEIGEHEVHPPVLNPVAWSFALRGDGDVSVNLNWHWAEDSPLENVVEAAHSAVYRLSTPASEEPLAWLVLGSDQPFSPTPGPTTSWDYCNPPERQGALLSPSARRPATPIEYGIGIMAALVDDRLLFVTRTVDGELRAYLRQGASFTEITSMQRPILRTNFLCPSTSGPPTPHRIPVYWPSS